MKPSWKLKRSFITNPPNRERVENIAENLSNTQAFDAIKEKEALRQYMALYIIKLLSEIRVM